MTIMFWIQLIVGITLLTLLASVSIKLFADKQTIVKLEEQLGKIRAENGRLHQFRQDAETSQRQLQSLLRQFRSLEESKNELELQLRQAETKISSNIASDAKMLAQHVSKEDFNTLQEDKRVLQEDFDMYKTSVEDEIKNYQKQIAKMTMQIDALQQERLEASLDMYKQKSSVSNKSETGSPANQQELNELSLENEKLTNVNNKLLQIISLQKSKLEKLDKE